MITPAGLGLRLAGQWSVAGSSAIRGHAMVPGAALEGPELANRLAAEPLGQFMLAADGGFAAVQVRPDRVMAGVDRVRSVPLFYAQGDDRVYLSDDARWIAGQLPPEPFDEVAQAELLALGYVTGPDTLHPRIKQLMAGQTLTVELGPRRAITDQYFNYEHGPYFDGPPDALLDDWDSTIRRVIERLLQSVAGRTIVVPLSGGLDSRLLLLELRRLGYDKVQTFTYGVPGNAEARAAQQVARELGYPWIPVPYSQAKWRQWYRTREFSDYVRYADGLATVVHVQDWPAVWELQATGKLPSDSIFVPGHNGGFLFGENGNVHRIARPTLDDLVRNIERVHYSNWQVGDPRLRAAMRRRLVDSLSGARLDRPGAATSAWEHWEWQERQSKFMCNSVRVYEFWGYGWRLPFWDVEAIRFWQRVPIEQRARSRLHRAYVERASRRAGLSTYPSDRIGLVRNTLLRDYVPEQVKRIARRTRAIRVDQVYEKHPMGWYGIIELSQFRQLYSGSETINSILALDRLGLLPAPTEDEG